MNEILTKCTKCDKVLSDFDVSARDIVVNQIKMSEEIKEKWESTEGMCLRCSYIELRPIFLELSGEAAFAIKSLDLVIVGGDVNK